MKEVEVWSPALFLRNSKRLQKDEDVHFQIGAAKNNIHAFNKYL